MFKNLKKQICGITYLLSNPKQLKWVLVRELRFGKRNCDKKAWVEWQKYDAQMHILMMQNNPSALNSSVLNLNRVKIFSEMVSDIGKNLKIIDVGCGDGVLSDRMQKIGHSVISVDLPKVATLAHKCGVASVIAGDAEQLAFKSESIDLIIASEVIEHLWNPTSFFTEAYRILKKNCYLMVETPEGEESLNYDSHKNYFTVERLQNLLTGKFILRSVKRLKQTGSAQTPTIILLFEKKEKN